jgi:hypothetical protein
MQNDEAPRANNGKRGRFVIRQSRFVIGQKIPELPGQRFAPPRRPVLDSTAKRPSTRPTQ